MTVMTRGVGEDSRYFSTRVDTRTKAISQHVKKQAPYYTGTITSSSSPSQNCNNINLDRIKVTC